MVVIARVKHPAPFRTRPLSTVALMVLRLKAWESKSLPHLASILKISLTMFQRLTALRGGFVVSGALLAGLFSVRG